MIILSTQDLELYGIRPTASTITIMGKAFVRGQTFAHRLRDAAIAIAEESLSQGMPCLLVDSDTHITIWKQQRLTSSALRQSRSATSSQHKPTMPNKDVKKYRGQVVFPPSSQDSSTSLPSSETPLTYRGRKVATEPSEERPSEQSNWTALNGRYSSPSKGRAKQLSYRLMQYRGQWVSADE